MHDGNSSRKSFFSPSNNPETDTSSIIFFIDIYLIQLICYLSANKHIDTKTQALIPMQKIMLLNPKGGCGKSTISTNLAAYYANHELSVAIADYDPQKSSLNWLRQRTFDFAPITSININTKQIEYPNNLDYLIMDTPAGLEKEKMQQLIQLTDNIIIPILPSPIDIQAAAYFIYQLLLKYRITNEDKNICLVANRVKQRSQIYNELIKFTNSIKLPLITSLRDSQNYVKYAVKGASIFDHKSKQTEQCRNDWLPLTHWIKEKSVT